MNIEDLVVIDQEWEVQFNVDSIKKTADMIKKQLKKEGECLIITYDHECPDFKVHIHIKKPVNEFLRKIHHSLGDVKNIRVLDLKNQRDDYIHILNKN